MQGGRTSSQRTLRLTSYFCRLNFSCRSNFSASRSRMVCHSSLALSLWEEPVGGSAKKGCGSRGAHRRGQDSDATISAALPGLVSAGSCPDRDGLNQRPCQPHAWTRATGEVALWGHGCPWRVSLAPSDGRCCQQQPGSDARQRDPPRDPGGCHSPSPSCAITLLSGLQTPGSPSQPRMLPQEVAPAAEPLSWTSLLQTVLTSACLH